MTDPLGIACGLPEQEFRARRAEMQSLLQKRLAYSPQNDGVLLEWAFSEETARTLLEFILFERVCCSGFRYELQFLPPHRSIGLLIGAPEEQVAALQAFYC